MNYCYTQSALYTELPSVYNISSVHSLLHCSGALNDLNNLSVGLSALCSTQLFCHCTLTLWRPLRMSPLSVSLHILWCWRCDERGGTDLTFPQTQNIEKKSTHSQACDTHFIHGFSLVFFTLTDLVARCQHADISSISVRLSVKTGRSSSCPKPSSPRVGPSPLTR